MQDKFSIGFTHFILEINHHLIINLSPTYAFLRLPFIGQRSWGDGIPGWDSWSELKATGQV